ncbi:MAG: hypothetical protein JJU35_09565 [Balneolales bacterium]|nr:hypothetical protein [Balneolales bacterium]
MSIEQKKLILINRIRTLEDELIIDKITDFIEPAGSELPEAILQLLKIADAEPEENLLPHTSITDLLNPK